MGPGRAGRIVTPEEFASRCGELLDAVETRGDEVRIIRDGAAVARLIPFTEELRPFVGRSKGTIEVSPDDLIAPVGAEWEAGQDL